MLTIQKNDGQAPTQKKINGQVSLESLCMVLPNDMSNHEIGIEQFIKLAMVFVQQG
jgi:hypothetical protein